MSRIFDSFNARIIQPWLMNNFEKTKNGKKIKELKNKYKGRRCFLVGNGPSLKVNDLDLLHKNNEITFGFNRIYNIFDETEWRPTFYISQDEKILNGSKDEIEKLDLKYKFIPINWKWYNGINIKSATYFMMKSPKETNFKPLDFSDDLEKVVYQGGTGMYTAAQLAAYMGFEEIYLIGVDHHFKTSINNKGEIIIDNSVKDYFTDKYNEDKKDLYIPNTEKSTFTYVAMKEQCEKRFIRVFNATRGGKLEVFERIEFDKIF